MPIINFRQIVNNSLYLTYWEPITIDPVCHVERSRDIFSQRFSHSVPSRQRWLTPRIIERLRSSPSDHLRSRGMTQWACVAPPNLHARHNVAPPNLACPLFGVWGCDFRLRLIHLWWQGLLIFWRDENYKGWKIRSWQCRYNEITKSGLLLTYQSFRIHTDYKYNNANHPHARITISETNDYQRQTENFADNRRIVFHGALPHLIRFNLLKRWYYIGGNMVQILFIYWILVRFAN